MNSSVRGKNFLPKWFALLVVLTVAAAASDQHKQNAPAPAPHAQAPSRPAPAPHAGTPAQHSGGANTNRGPGGANANRGPGGANANRGPAGANANRGPGGANANRGPAGANANKGGPGAANKGGANANRGPGGANANKGGPGANKGGANANRGPGGMNANKGGPGAANKGGANASRGPGGVNRRQPAGTKTVALKNGGNATFRKNGQVRTIQTKSGMRINHGMHGERHITSTHNGRTVVSMGRRGGYSQRAYYNRGGVAYVQRTYYVNGTYYAYGYSSYYYGGYPYYGYAPSYYYGPAYYGWAYNPWPAPVYYNWGWGGAPWYGYYGPYYQPYPAYPTAAFWLTDYLIAANLQAAYAAQAAANGEAGPGPMAAPPEAEIASLWTTDPLIAANLDSVYGAYMLGAAPQAKGNATQLTPEVKQALADEMKNEIAAEKDAAAGTKKAASGEKVPAALDPNTRYFVVSSDLDLTTSDGAECALTPGDVLYRVGDTPDDDHMVDATVKSSKKDECAIGATVGVEVGDLQEMHNQLRIQMDAGLKELAAKQGKNGLPAAPDTKTQAGEVPAPSPDKGVESDLKSQQQEADQAESEAQQSN
jgi:hypothetical protein